MYTQDSKYKNVLTHQLSVLAMMHTASDTGSSTTECCYKTNYKINYGFRYNDFQNMPTDWMTGMKTLNSYKLLCYS